MASRKLSGAALAAELSNLPFPGPQTAPVQAVQGPTDDGTGEQLVAPSPPPPPPPAPDPAPLLPREAAASRPIPKTAPNPKGGRPPKAGVDGIPVNVRLSQADHLALAKLSGKLMVPGRPLPTVQDVVRGLIRGALGEPELALRLCRQGDL
jgi:hypothetical protein